MSSPTRRILPRLEAAASPGQLAALTDDLLEEIFVRIASPIDLARAATACASFHRLITGPAFLRRYRSLHPPLILGFVNGNLEGFQPAEAPHPSAPAGHEDNEASFRVIVGMQCATDLVVFVYSSGSGSWSAVSISQDTVSGQIGFSMTGCPCYAYGCIYWQVGSRNKLLKLNKERMEFSTVDLPLGQDKQNCTIVVVEEGDVRIGFFSHIMFGRSVYYYTKSMQNEGNRANEWQIKNVIQLPTDGYGLQIIGTPQRYIFLIGDTTCFALEIKTMKIERVSNITIHNFLPFLGFPPSMSPRRI
ncbi:unnamed protein product [Urochloa decumbens]|uniref:F-box domain-containing protein n=1 Tax=Urochloa decumbens TaxID=240449 RepID=A0ABC9FCR8_9POAL